MRALFVTSEAYPLAKSGGLADVSSALPAALMRQGIDTRIILPAYPGALLRLKNPRIDARLAPVLGIADGAIISGLLPDSSVPVWLVYAPSLFYRKGGLYQNCDGQDWKDNAQRFAYFAHVAAQIASGRLLGWKPDVVHANDWHAGLLPLLLSLEEARPAIVTTIHNLAFQGNFPGELLCSLGIPERLFTPAGIEFYGQVSFLKAAIRYSDRITTVSPTYAREVLQPEFGWGFDGILRDRQEDFCGILNGIDADRWNPASDPALPRNYGLRDISGKRICKAELQRELGLEISPETPLIGFASRLAHQKMADVIADVLPAILQGGSQFCLVGEGDHGIEAAFEKIGRQFKARAAIHVGYDEMLAHRLQAGADILLSPARYEPCGLTQLYALRYGSVPIVRRTGGLADTVVGATAENLSERTATGFVFEDAAHSDLIGAVERAVSLFREPLAWRRLQQQGMAQDFSWRASAARYGLLYKEILGADTSAATETAFMETALEEPERLIAR